MPKMTGTLTKAIKPLKESPEVATKGSVTTIVELETPRVPFEVPQWFISNCIKTSEELIEQPDPLIVRKTNYYAEPTQMAPAEEVHGSFEVESALYDPLSQNILNQSSPDEALSFAKDALLVRIEAELPSSAIAADFLTAVVEHFARSVAADLITFNFHDFKNLAEHHTFLNGNNFDHAAFLEFYNTANGKAKGKSSPFDAIFSSVISKRKNVPAKRPLVIHLPEPLDIIYCSQPMGMILWEMQYFARNNPSFTSVLVISTSLRTECRFGFNGYTGSTNKVLDDAAQKLNDTRAALMYMGRRPAKDAIIVVPTWSEAQYERFHERSSFTPLAKHNIQDLQFALRSHQDRRNLHPLLVPYADWSFLKNTCALKALEKEVDNRDYIEIESYAIQNGQLCTEQIREGALRFGYKKSLLTSWNNWKTHAEPISKWSGFPLRVREILEDIEKTDDKTYTYEKQLFNNLIAPKEAGESWTDIAIDPETRDAIIRITQQPGSNGKEAYGILKQGRVGGAVLYGPPGTGKTHLARILAQEFKGVTICVSSADLESKWVGESEKAIQGLFNLAKMIGPSIIFFDEADSFFRKRTGNEQGYDRKRVNQLLHEMDGLKMSESAPFVLLATNFPSDLDEAVLRRAPSRLFIGLPPINIRKEIFVIFLKDEILDADVDIQELALKTPRFSGSDIKTLCVQAALLCEKFVPGGKDTGKRILKLNDFEKALKTTSPTTSKLGLENITAFAKEFDPSAYLKIVKVVEDY